MSQIQPQAEVHQVDPLQIVVGERLRRDLKDPSYLSKINELTASMRTHGLLHPIILTRDLKLVSGFTRLTIAKRLAWPTIPSRFLDECDDLTLKEIELEENLARSDLTWLDVVSARSQLHRLKLQIYGQADTSIITHVQTPNGPSPSGWSVPKSAAAMGIQSRQLQYDLAINAAIELVPSLADEPSKNVVMKKIDRLVEDIEFQLQLIDVQESQLRAVESNLILGDCINELVKIPTDSVDLIITDPPYGVDYDSVGGSGYRTEVEFEDSPEAVLALLRSALKEMRRVLRSNGHLYAFFGIHLWSETLAIYRSQGFDPDPLPLVWVKNTHGTVDWDHRYAPAWEPILYCSSSRRLARFRSNVFAHSSPNPRSHANEKPVPLLRELIEMSSVQGELVLDPFAGSGSTLVAAKETGRKWLGIEKQPRMHDIAKLRLLK